MAKPKSNKKKKAVPRNDKSAKRARYHYAVAKDTPVIVQPMNDNTRGLYNDEILPKVEQLAASGLNNKQIAEAICIGEKTFYEWMQRYPQFSHSIKKYRGVADIMVENALFKSAIGTEYDEIKKERKFNKKTGQFEVVVTEVINKYIPGNSTAQIFYLKNRMPDRYRDKVETAITLPQDISQLSFSLKRREE